MNKNDAGVIVAGNSLRGPGRPPGGTQGGWRDACRPHLPVPRCRRGQLRLYGLIYIIYCSSVNYLTSSFSKFWITHELLFLVKLTCFCCLLAGRDWHCRAHCSRDVKTDWVSDRGVPPKDLADGLQGPDRGIADRLAAGVQEAMGARARARGDAAGGGVVAEANGADRHLEQGLHVHLHLPQLPVRIRTMAGGCGRRKGKETGELLLQTDYRVMSE